MKAIIILGLSTLVQTAFSQQQQQIQSRNILVNNLSNVNYVNVAALSNAQVNFNNNKQKQQVRNVSRATPARRATQAKTNTTVARNTTTEVRRRSRPKPRTVNTTPVNNMKGLIIANMMASCPEYGKYADEVLAKQMDPTVLAEVRALEAKKDFANPRYMELLLRHFYNEHLCRLAEWPEPVNRAVLHTPTQ